MGRKSEGTKGRIHLPTLPNHVATRNRAGKGMVCVVTNRRTFSPSERGMRACIVARNGLTRSRYGTPLGQVILAALGGLFAGALVWMVRTGRVPDLPRILTGGVEEVTP